MTNKWARPNFVSNSHMLKVTKRRRKFMVTILKDEPNIWLPCGWGSNEDGFMKQPEISASKHEADWQKLLGHYPIYKSDEALAMAIAVAMSRAIAMSKPRTKN